VPIAGPWVAACASNPASAITCAAIAAAFAALLIYGGKDIRNDLDNFADSFADWWASLSTDKQTQFGTYVAANGELVNFRPDLLADLNSFMTTNTGATGFTSTLNPANRTITGSLVWTAYTETILTKSQSQVGICNTGVNCEQYEVTVIPAGGALTSCTGTGPYFAYVQIGEPPGKSWKYDVSAWYANGATQWGSNVAANRNNVSGTSDSFGTVSVSMTGTTCAALATNGLMLRLGAQVSTLSSLAVDQARWGFMFGPTYVTNGQASCFFDTPTVCGMPKHAVNWVSSPTMATGDYVYRGPTATTGLPVRVPQNGDDLKQIPFLPINPFVLGADGAVGPAVLGQTAQPNAAATPAASITDQSNVGLWWGWFGTLTAAVNALKLPLTTIADWVTDFPTPLSETLATAIASSGVATAIQDVMTDLFVPTEGIQMRLDSEYSRWENLPPFLLGAAILAAFTAFIGLTTVEATELCWPVMLRDIELPFCIDLDPIATPLLIAKYLLDFYVLTLLVTWMVGWWRSFIAGE